jgi:Fe-Mn family superoxide dismutase
MHRRDVLVLSAAAVAASTVAAPRPARAAAPFTQPPLPFAEGALAPTIGERTVALHCGKHHKAYFDKLNMLAPGTRYEAMTLEEVVRASAETPADRAVFNQAGQAWNHIFYWDQFVPGGPAAPEGGLEQAIAASFGDRAGLTKAFKDEAGAVFGSGWVWLVPDGNKLAVIGTAGGDSPFAHGVMPLLGIDVWEHAYYLDYQNRRADHVAAVLDTIVNWSVVAERLAA